MKIIPETHSDLLKDETRAFVYLATLMVDGSPQVTPVWFDVEGEYIRCALTARPGLDARASGRDH